MPDATTLEAERDKGNQRLCELVDWLAAHTAAVSHEARAHAEAAIDKYLNRQFRYELSTSAKPMFVEMSGGAEKN